MTQPAPVRPTVYEFRLPIRTPAALAAYLRHAYGIVIPDVQVCPHHTTPWQAFKQAYFAEASVTVWKASRGFGGKSFMLALLGKVEAETLKVDVNVLGGSGTQSQRVHEYMDEFWRKPAAPRSLLRSDPAATHTRLAWGNRIQALMASSKSVRGPHPVRLRVDECIAGDARILTRRGLVPMRELRPGDQVAALPTAGNGLRWGVATTLVSKGERRTLRLELATGATLRCTPDHYIRTPGGWRQAQTLRPGEAVLTAEGSAALQDRMRATPLRPLSTERDRHVPAVLLRNQEDRGEPLPRMRKSHGRQEPQCDPPRAVHAVPPSISRRDEASSVPGLRCASQGQRENLPPMSLQATGTEGGTLSGLREAVAGLDHQALSPVLARGTVGDGWASENDRRARGRDEESPRTIESRATVRGVADEPWHTVARPAADRAVDRRLPAAGASRRRRSARELLARQADVDRPGQSEAGDARGDGLPRALPPDRADALLVAGSLGVAEVVAITDGGVVDVWDITVPEFHSFVANGVVVHNCDEVELKILDAAMGQTMSKPPADEPGGIVVPAQTVLSSTHQYPDGTFTEVKKRATDKGWPFMEWCFLESMQPHGWLDPAEVDRKRHEVTAAMFAVEYEGQEPSAEGRAILADAVDWTFRAELGEFAGEIGRYYEFEAPEPGAAYATGADWAKDRDFTTIDTLRIDVRPVRRVAWERRQREPYPVMVEAFNRRTGRYPGKAAHDKTGVGNALDDWLVGEVEGVTMVGKVRTDLFGNYIVGLESQAIASPRIAPCESEHRYCVAAGSLVTTAGGLIPIERVRAGMLVATRRGWRRVLHRTFTGIRPVMVLKVGETRLALTGDHRVATLGGWAPAESLFVGALVYGIASTATARPTPIAHDGVLGRERVAALTCGGGRLLRDRARSAQHVFAMRDGFEVIGIAAGSVAARVVDLETIGDRTMPKFVGNREREALAADVATGIAVPIRVFRPDPAPRRLVDPTALLDIAPVDRDGMQRNAIARTAADAPLPGDALPAIEACLHVIDAISIGAPTPVFDIGVEGDAPEFVANGIVVHNCTRDDLYGKGHPPDSVVAGAMAWKAAGITIKPGADVW